MSSSIFPRFRRAAIARSMKALACRSSSSAAPRACKPKTLRWFYRSPSLHRLGTGPAMAGDSNWRKDSIWQDRPPGLVLESGHFLAGIGRVRVIRFGGGGGVLLPTPPDIKKIE